MHYVYKQDFKEIGISLNKSRNELKAIYRSVKDLYYVVFPQKLINI